MSPQCDQSCVQGTVQQTRTTLTTKKKHYKQTSFICGSIHSARMLQVCGHIKHVVVLVALLRVLTSLVVNCSHIFTFHLYVNFFTDFVDCHTAKTGLLRCLSLHLPDLACVVRPRSVCLSQRGSVIGGSGVFGWRQSFTARGPFSVWKNEARIIVKENG